MIAKRKSNDAEKGFTLLEVLVAISLMSMGLMVLLDSQGGSMIMTQYAKDLTVATQLARARTAMLMQEIEDKKITYGLSKSSCKEGDFSDDGQQFKDFKWKYCIKKVEIATPTDLPGFGGGKGNGDDADKQKGQNAQMLMSSLGIPMGSTNPSDIASSLGPFMGMIKQVMKAQFEQLKESLRELQITVYWERNGQKHKIAVTTHLFHFNKQTGFPDGWPAPQPDQQNTTQ